MDDLGCEGLPDHVGSSGSGIAWNFGHGIQSFFCFGGIFFGSCMILFMMLYALWNAHTQSHADM